MKCPKCKEGSLLYAKRGVIEEFYKTDKSGEPVGNALRKEKDFFYNPHHYCEECGFTFDIADKVEI